MTWDRVGLFHKLAASFFYAGYSIKSARAISREDNIAIDTFVISPRDQENFSEHYARQIFEEGLNKKLASTDFGDSKLDDLVETLISGDRESSNPDAQQLSPKVEVYEEISKRKAIVETHSADTPGLLYRLAQVVHSHEFDVTSAHIHTERGIAFDEALYKIKRSEGANRARSTYEAQGQSFDSRLNALHIKRCRKPLLSPLALQTRQAFLQSSTLFQ